MYTFGGDLSIEEEVLFGDKKGSLIDSAIGL
jgi:hypothetical protein